MRLLLLGLTTLLFAAPAQAAFGPAQTVPTEALSYAASAVAGNDAGAVLAVVGGPRRVVLHERPARGVHSPARELLPGRAFAVEAVLDDAGGALVAVSRQAGSVLLQRAGGGAFGPPEAIGGPGSQVEGLVADHAGNAALLVTESAFSNASRLVLRTRAAGAGFGPPVTLTAGGTTAAVAFGPGGRLGVAWIVRDGNFSSIRLEARTGTARDGLGPTRSIARAEGNVNLGDPGIAFARDGTALVSFSTLRSPSRISVQDVRVASAAPGRAFGAPRVLATDGAATPRIAAGGATVAVAWASSSPRPGQAGIRVALRRADGSFTPAEAASPPQRGFRPGGRVAGATESRAGAPDLAVSPRGDVAVGFAFGPDRGPATAYVTVRPRGARAVEPPQPTSPLGLSARPLPPLWAGDGTLLAPFLAGQERAASAPARLGVAERAPGSPPAPPARDRTAPGVTTTPPTLADLAEGLLATTIGCAEACAFTSRSQINVGGDIYKPRGLAVTSLPAGGSTRVALPLQESQRRGFASGARVKAVLSFSVVDRFGNAVTERTRICRPLRPRCQT